jgi:hypothetical protein
MRTSYTMLMVTIFLVPHLMKVEPLSSIKIKQGTALKATINSPLPGEVVQGAVVIRGNTSLDGFLAYEVDFAYSTDTTQTWFLIHESTISIQDGILAVWDTTTITDGEYNLRLMITQTGGESVEVQVSNLRVHNYTPKETDTPMPTQSHATLAVNIPTNTEAPQLTATPKITSLPVTPVSLSTNPAEISPAQVMMMFGKGAAITISIFAILGVYKGIRAALHSRK